MVSPAEDVLRGGFFRVWFLRRRTFSPGPFSASGFSGSGRFVRGFFRVWLLRRRTFCAGLFRVWFLRRRTFCAGALSCVVSPPEDVLRGVFFRVRVLRRNADPVAVGSQRCRTFRRFGLRDGWPKGLSDDLWTALFSGIFPNMQFSGIEKLVGQPFFCGRRVVNRRSGSAFRATIPERP